MEATKKEKPPVVEVHWRDHSYCETVEKTGIVERWTVGFILEETEAFVKVAMNYDEDGTFEHVMTIGKEMVFGVRKVPPVARKPRAPKQKALHQAF